MNKQLCKHVCKELATSFGTGAAVTTATMAGSWLVVNAVLPNEAFEETPSMKQRLSLAVIGSALIGAAAIGLKASFDDLYHSSKFKLKNNEESPNTK